MFSTLALKFKDLHSNLSMAGKNYNGGSDGKESACNAEDLGSVPE